MNEQFHGIEDRHSVKGGKFVDKPMLSTMDKGQIQASSINADLRKKLRVDRVRKMTMGSAAAN